MAIKPDIPVLLRKLADGIEAGQCGDAWGFLLISEEEHANLPGVLRDISTGQELLAIEIASLMEEPFYKKRPDARVALAAAAGIVRRGRKLTEREQLLNLTGGIREVDSELAGRIEKRAGLSVAQSAARVSKVIQRAKDDVAAEKALRDILMECDEAPTECNAWVVAIQKIARSALKAST